MVESPKSMDTEVSKPSKRDRKSKGSNNNKASSKVTPSPTNLPKSIKGTERTKKEDGSSSSPATVADVAPNSQIVKDELMLSPRTKRTVRDDEEFPFDESPNPASDGDISVSPLPFDQREDPSTLMELPDNILSLPISPCGPNDAIEI